MSEVTSNTLLLHCEDKEKLSIYYCCIGSLFTIRESLLFSVDFLAANTELRPGLVARTLDHWLSGHRYIDCANF